jgi:putative hydrolase of the HAD superfamily
LAVRRVTRLRAVLLDALGTLVALEPPAPALRRVLRGRFGIELSEEQADAAFSAEIRYYRRHLADGRDEAAVAALRDRCAEVLFDALGPDPALTAVPARDRTAVLLESLVFRPFDDVLGALRQLRRSGLALVVASNWDASLPGTLDRVGLLDAVDGVVCSAAVGAAKPDPAVFFEALRIAGAAPEEAVHVGDSPGEDVAGARSAGIEPLLLVRGDSAVPPTAGATVVQSLAELPALLGPRASMVAGR